MSVPGGPSIPPVKVNPPARVDSSSSSSPSSSSSSDSDAIEVDPSVCVARFPHLCPNHAPAGVANAPFKPLVATAASAALPRVNRDSDLERRPRLQGKKRPHLRSDESDSASSISSELDSEEEAMAPRKRRKGQAQKKKKKKTDTPHRMNFQNLFEFEDLVLDQGAGLAILQNCVLLHSLGMYGKGSKIDRVIWKPASSQVVFYSHLFRSFTPLPGVTPASTRQVSTMVVTLDTAISTIEFTYNRQA